MLLGKPTALLDARLREQNVHHTANTLPRLPARDRGGKALDRLDVAWLDGHPRQQPVELRFWDLRGQPGVVFSARKPIERKGLFQSHGSDRRCKSTRAVGRLQRRCRASAVQLGARARCHQGGDEKHKRHLRQRCVGARRMAVLTFGGRRWRERRLLRTERIASRVGVVGRADPAQSLDGRWNESGTRLLEQLSELRATPEPHLSVRRHPLDHASLDHRIDAGGELAKRRRPPFDDLLHGVVLAVRSEGQLPRHELVERRSDREDIRPLVDVLSAFDLLGAHVVDGAHLGAGARPAAFRPEGLAAHLRDPKIDERRLQSTLRIARDDHVLRLDVAVDDLLGVGIVQRTQELAEDRLDLADGRLAR